VAQLIDGVYGVRTKLGEQNPNYWSTEDIIYDLNWGLKEMCSAAQNLETAIQFPWPNVAGTTNPIQEAPLRPWVDQILSVAIYAGQLFQLQYMEATDVQVATRVGNIPLGFYTRTDTREEVPQGAGATTGDLSVIPIPGQATDFQTVLGLWPVPSSNYDTTVTCTKFHPWVTNPTTPLGIPDQFMQGLIAYGVARAKEKESAFDESAYYDKIYQMYKQKMIDYYINHKQLRTFPQYGGTSWPSLARGSSSIIFVDQNPALFNQ
jgi:hypothetical protein